MEEAGIARSESQPGIWVTALGTRAEIRARRRGIKRVAADAMEGGFAAFAFEAAMIPAVIPQPQTDKDSCDNHAVEDGGSGEFEHREESLRLYTA